MFKRIQKLVTRVEEDEAAGVPVGQDAPVEMRIDEDSSDSDDSSDDDGDSDDDSSSDDEEQEECKKETAAAKKGKGKQKDSDDDDDSDDSDDSDSDDEDGEPASGFGVDVPITITQALESTIYINTNAPKKGDYVVRSCVCCPVAQLKSDKTIETHLASGAHGRRMKRFAAFVSSKLNERERSAPPTEGGADPRGVMAEVEAETARAQKKLKAELQAKKKKHVEERRARKQKKMQGKTVVRAEAALKVKESGEELNRKQRREIAKAALLAKTNSEAAAAATGTPTAAVSAAAVAMPVASASVDAAPAPKNDDSTPSSSSKKRKANDEAPAAAEGDAPVVKKQLLTALELVKAQRKEKKRLKKEAKAAKRDAPKPAGKPKRDFKYGKQKEQRTAKGAAAAALKA